MNWLRLSFESSLDQISLPSMLVAHVCRNLNLDEVLAYQIELCLVEAVTNAIRHAYHDRPGNEVAVLLRFDARRIEIEVSDSGDAMAPEHVARLQVGAGTFKIDPGDLANLPEGGMGLKIMSAMMDETSYCSAGGINHLRLTKYLQR